MQNKSPCTPCIPVEFCFDSGEVLLRVRESFSFVLVELLSGTSVSGGDVNVRRCRDRKVCRTAQSFLTTVSDHKCAFISNVSFCSIKNSHGAKKHLTCPLLQFSLLQGEPSIIFCIVIGNLSP